MNRADSAAAQGIADIPVGFKVVNQNGPRVPCTADGASYEIRGDIVGPRAALEKSAEASAALHLHGLGFAGWFWHFTQVPSYNYATLMAQLGHVSVVIDRLGHGGSAISDGTAKCIGAQADMAHQIVQQLKAGTYARAMGFSRIALAGHSAGGETAGVEAYSFGDIDAMIVMAWVDQASSPVPLQTFLSSGQACLTSSDGYAAFGQTNADIQQAMNSSA